MTSPTYAKSDVQNFSLKKYLTYAKNFLTKDLYGIRYTLFLPCSFSPSYIRKYTGWIANPVDAPGFNPLWGFSSLFLLRTMSNRELPSSSKILIKEIILFSSGYFTYDSYKQIFVNVGKYVQWMSQLVQLREAVYSPRPKV